MSNSPFLRTRVARRILLLFLVCAVGPLAVLAFAGYRHVAADLELAARERLRGESKTSGLMLLDRLNSLATLLDLLATQSGTGRALHGLDIVSGAEAPEGSFRTVALIRSSGAMESLVGSLPDRVPLRRDQVAHLLAGKVTIVTAPGPQGLRVFMVRSVDAIPGSQLWAEIEPGAVWGGDRLTPTGAEACLTTAAGEVLACSSPEAARRQSLEPETSSYRWERGGRGYMVGQWTVFLTRSFATPPWIIGLSLPETTVFASLTALRHTFLLGLGLALAVVFALSHVHLRRSMHPLEALEAATRRVAAGRFDEPIAIRSDDEFGSLSVSFNQMAGDLDRQFRSQRALGKIHQAALAAAGHAPVLEALFAERAELLPGAGLTVALARPDDPFWWTVIDQSDSAIGQSPRDVQPRETELAELRAQSEGLVVRRGERARSYFRSPEEVLLQEVIVLPIIRKGGLAGALVLPCERNEEGRPETLARAKRSARQIAVAISNAQLVEQLDAMNLGALTTLARTIDAVSPWTAGHSERVTIGALEVGRRLGISEGDLELLQRGGLLHDIGKIGVPAAILDKPGPLTAEEFTEVRKHPTTGARILAPIGAFRSALPLVLHHHELLDGSGYPYGLKGDQIPPLVRILTVADVFDALVSERPYRPAWPVTDALAYMRTGAGTRFDAAAVEALSDAVASGLVSAMQLTAGLGSAPKLGRPSPLPRPSTPTPPETPFDSATSLRTAVRNG